jgi:hypothetical protein
MPLLILVAPLHQRFVDDLGPPGEKGADVVPCMSDR